MCEPLNIIIPIFKENKMPIEKSEYLTEEGLKKLIKEVEHLETVERSRISQQISEARDKGDLSENAEYDAAKAAQELIEMRIARLKEKIYNARVIDSSQVDRSKVSILSTVHIKNLTKGIIHIYTLVPESEADLSAGRISIKTPIAQGLLGKKIGETSNIRLPNGNQIVLEILKIH